MITVFLFIFGAIAGSFMNVCIYRMPRKQSLAHPRSHCAHCRKTIRWYDNIPVLSFLLLKARCRYCKKRISFVYPAVEILSGLLASFLFIRFGMTPKFFILWLFASALTVASFIDLGFHEIPDEITLPGIALGLLLAAVYPALTGKGGHLLSALDSLLGVIAGGASIFILGFFGEFVFRKEAMGGGDVKLLAMIGAFLGWKLALFTFFLAPIFGSIAGIALKIKKGAEIIPYGPHLSLAALVAVFYGEEILKRIFSF